MGSEQEVIIKHIEAETLGLYIFWGISYDGITALGNCRISSQDLLKIIKAQDIEEIFNKRELMADRIKFRHNLNKWREINHCELLPCCESDKSLSIISQWVSANTSSTSETLFKGKINSNLELNIEDILKNTVSGRDIIKIYKERSILCSTDQTNLSRCIVDHFYNKSLKMCPKTMRSVAKEIVKLFPNEDERTYYVPRENGKQPSGKIFDRYFNVAYNRKKKSEFSVAQKTPKLNTDNDESKDNTEADNGIQQEEFLQKKLFLFYNCPENISSLWKETSLKRMKEPKYPLSEFLSAWPRYKDPNGEELVYLDFETIQPGRSNKIFEKFDEFEIKIIKIFFPSAIKEKSCLEMYKKMGSPEICTDSRHFFFLNLLHTLITPPRLSKTCKPSISDGQKDMFVHLECLNNFKQREDELKLQAISEKLQLLPKIFVVGESLEQLKEFYVYIDGICFKVPSLLHAMDLLIKSCFVFNLEYSQKSKYVWTFLQEHLYEIIPNEQIPKVRNIIAKLENVVIE